MKNIQCLALSSKKSGKIELDEKGYKGGIGSNYGGGWSGESFNNPSLQQIENNLGG